MKNRIIIFSLITVFACIALAACGTGPAPQDTADIPQDTEPAHDTEDTGIKPAETKTAGSWSVDVPDGFEFAIGDVFDENDDRYFSVKRTFLSYLDFSADGEELIKLHYNDNKNTYTNEQTDVSATYGANEWTGFQYSDGFGGFGFEAYTVISGQYIRVSSAGFRFDDAAVQQILASVQYTGSGN